MSKFDKFEDYVKEFKKLEKELTRPEVINNRKKFKEYSKRHGELRKPVEKYNRYKKLKDEYAQAESLYQSEKGEMKELAAREKEKLADKIENFEEDLKEYLLPQDPDGDKDVIIELRAGTGGDEAALFCAKLFRMYQKFFDTRGWKTEIYDLNKTGLGGYKEIVCSISGGKVYGNLKWESGVHRVQRIPETETGGRIHTSACSVAVLPKADPVEVDIKKEDLRIDTYRASGKGGQHVNVTDSAVRITHEPTGIVAQCQDERSQKRNRDKAMDILSARVKEKKLKDQQKKKANRRREQIGSGDRSEKIRTYNFTQNRITDHRVNLTLYNLEAIMDGEFEKFFRKFKKKVREKQLENL
ncbi:MAG: peptide chain release factor 1 [Elusimicrobiota bacterium]